MRNLRSSLRKRRLSSEAEASVRSQRSVRWRARWRGLGEASEQFAIGGEEEAWKVNSGSEDSEVRCSGCRNSAMRSGGPGGRRQRGEVDDVDGWMDDLDGNDRCLGLSEMKDGWQGGCGLCRLKWPGV